MILPASRFVPALALALGCLSAVPSAAAEPPHPWLAVRWRHLSKALEEGAEVPLARRLLEDGRLFPPPARAAIDRARHGLDLLARLFGTSPGGAVERLLGEQGRLLVWSGGEEGPHFLLSLRSPDEAAAADLFDLLDDALLALAADDDARSAGSIRTANGDEFHALSGAAVLLSDDEDALAWAIQDPRATLPQDDEDGTPVVELRLDLRAVRADRGDESPPFPRDNPLAFLVAAGWIDAFSHSNALEASLRWRSGGLELEARVDGVPAPDLAWSSPEAPPALPAVRLPGAVARISLARDFAGFFARRFEQFAPELESGLLEFENVFSLFFAGRSFGDEILPSLGSRATLLVSRHSFDALPAPPEIVLPAFTLMVPLRGRDGDPGERAYLGAFQTLIGIVNADRAQNGEAPLLLDTDRVAGVRVVSASFAPDAVAAGDRAPMEYNFSPAVAVAGDRLIVGSARPAVRTLVEALAANPSHAPAPDTLFEVRPAAVAALLAENREPWIAQRILEAGASRAEAERFVDAWIEALSLLGSLAVDIEAADTGLALHARVGLADVAARPSLEDGSR